MRLYRLKKAKRPFRPAALLLAALLLTALFASCKGNHSGAIEVVIPPAGDEAARTASPTEPAHSDPSAEPSSAPSQYPETLRSRALAGEVIPVSGGKAAGAGMEPVSVDIDGDGAEDLLSVEDIGGGPVFCIGGEPFLDVGQSVYIASPDGKNIVFLTEKAGEEGFRMFFADYNGNLFCRFVGRMANGRAEEFPRLSSWEEYVRAGLEIPLQSPILYEEGEPGRHTVRLDMDGDGAREEISFDGLTLTLNGEDHSELLTATLPRFIWDEGRGSIALYGSAGDLAIFLFIENGKVVKETSYAQLL